jgi:hypothetical protein
MMVLPYGSLVEARASTGLRGWLSWPVLSDISLFERNRKHSVPGSTMCDDEVSEPRNRPALPV